MCYVIYLVSLELIIRNVLVVRRVSEYVIKHGKQENLRHIKLYRRLWLCINSFQDMLGFGLFVTLFMGGAMTIFMNYISVHAAKLQLSPEILFYAVYCALLSIVLELFI